MGSSLRHRSNEAADEQRQSLMAQAQQCNMRASVLFFIGLPLTVASLVCLVKSFRRHEQVSWRSIPVSLLVLYVLLQFTLV